MPHPAITAIADHIVAARERPVTGPVRDATLRCLFDLTVAAAAGIRDNGPRAARQACGIMGPGSLPVWFTGGTASVIGAAWANSAAAASQDLDDGHRLARGHPGAVVIPVVMAMGPAQGASMDRMLTAIVIGYEVGVTIAAARRSYGNTGTWGAYAAVAAAAALSDIPAAVIEHGLAIAGESAPNQLFASAPHPRDPDPEGSDVKEGIPWSVVTGLAALRLAQAGQTGPRNILESRPHYDLAQAPDLGADPHIGRVYHKLYACCRHIHTPLDALLGVLDRHRPDRIDAIRVETTSGALRISNRVRPENLTDLQYSIPYCLALAALRGPGALARMDARVLHDPAAEALAQRVSLVLSPEIDARFPRETLARVSMTSGGQRLASPLTAPRGEASAPLGWDDLRGKAAAIATSLDAPGLADALDGLTVRFSAGRAVDPGQVLGFRLDATA